MNFYCIKCLCLQKLKIFKKNCEIDAEINLFSWFINCGFKKFSICHGYRDFKDLPRGTTADRLFFDKTFNITRNPKYDGYQRGLASMVHKLL